MAAILGSSTVEADARMKRMKLFFKISYFMASYVYMVAELAVAETEKNVAIQQLGEKEGMASFCPRCGQQPVHDLRHDDAFELAFPRIAKNKRGKDLHFAIELANWLR